MPRAKGIFEPTQENLEVIKKNQSMVETLEVRTVRCLCCGHKTINIHGKTDVPVFVSQKCNVCKSELPYNLADYRIGVSLRQRMRIS